MNLLLQIGLMIAIFFVLAYVITALCKNKKPELVDGIMIFVGAVSIAGAIRLIGFVFTEQFANIATHSQSSAGWWSLSLGDAVFLIIGGIALAWISLQTIWGSFSKLRL